ncbi:MAG: hypothetical protein GXP54_13355 [Deltaproteobacteria bacterium]|nr:hypothetical protein [Deltaproteobacteria bacterium]
MIGMTMVDKMKRTQFLGREFLTWLLFRAATDEGVFRDDEAGEVQVLFERAITLEGDNPAREMTTIKVDDPTDSAEVMLALRIGKKVSRAKLLVEAGGNEYALTLDAASLAMKSIKLPESMEMDPMDVMTERAGFAADLETALHRLFLGFIRLRRDLDAWSIEVSKMAQWIGPFVQT